MIWEYEHHPGFSRNLYIRLWWLSLTISTYEDHWYVALQWSRPNRRPGK